MPGYEPFLLCDFHAHTQWSDGKLSVAEVVDLYGSTGKFDVIAITDHILMKRDLLARAGRLATLGRRAFGVREEDFIAHLILKEIRRQDALSIAIRTTARPGGSRSAPVICGITATSWPISWTCGRRQTATTSFPSQASNTSRTWRAATSQTEAPVFVEDAGAMREELAGGERRAAPQRRYRADVVPQRLVGRRLARARQVRALLIWNGAMNKSQPQGHGRHPLALIAADRFAEALRLAQAEFREMPGLKLTEAQAARLLSFDSALCSAVLATLVDQRFLTRTRDTFQRAH
jgi:hypothetical protein